MSTDPVSGISNLSMSRALQTYAAAQAAALSSKELASDRVAETSTQRDAAIAAKEIGDESRTVRPVDPTPPYSASRKLGIEDTGPGGDPLKISPEALQAAKKLQQ